MMRCLLQKMREIHPRGRVRLAGYSFGACVAIEMVLQLQQQQTSSGDGVQSIILLDGSHSFIAAHTDRTRQQLALSGDTAGIETGVICTFISQLAFRLAPSDEVCCFLIRLIFYLWIILFRYSIMCSLNTRQNYLQDKSIMMLDSVKIKDKISRPRHCLCHTSSLYVIRLNPQICACSHKFHQNTDSRDVCLTTGRPASLWLTLNAVTVHSDPSYP